MLKYRLMTAAILIPLVLFLLFYLEPPTFFVVSGLFFLLASVEWTSFMGLRSFLGRIFYIVIMATSMAMMLKLPVTMFFILTVTFMWWMAALGLVCFYPRSKVLLNSKSVIGVMGILTIVPCWLALNYLRAEEYGLYIILFIFALIWGADTVAYFVGRKWGKTKLAPLVSPGKSVQGAVGALIYAAVLTIIAGLFTDTIPIVLFSAVMLSVVTVVFSIVGDLFESMLKREVGLKDSGAILPGHGGLLDRIDSLTAAAPVYVFGSILLSIMFTYTN